MRRTPSARRPHRERLHAGVLRAGTLRAGLKIVTFGFTLGLAGCSLDSLVNNNELPPTVTDPAITETPEGALAAYHGAVAQFRYAFGGSETSVILATGLLSDELSSIGISEADQRMLPEGLPVRTMDETYSRLQKVRGQASQAIGLLRDYRPADSALVGHVYALQGYTEIFLAELFCSGIPLSTLDYHGDYTYQPGSSTQEVLAHARALFDTAISLGHDSTRVVQLARLGQARVLLAAGQVAAAATDAALVPDDYRDTLTFTTGIDTVANSPNFAYFTGTWPYSVANLEGGNGLNYASSDDPRLPVTVLGTVTGLGTQWYPANYLANGSSPLVLASGVEARLIEAEAALQASPGGTEWLDRLNALRTDGTQDGAGIYQPGKGGVAGLAPLSDPGSDSARVSLVFRERAFWLYLTGHRQGDLRRQLRQYPQYWSTQEKVYPVGPYMRPTGTTQYGSDVTAPIPREERVLNPRFTGCFSRQA